MVYDQRYDGRFKIFNTIPVPDCDPDHRHEPQGSHDVIRVGDLVRGWDKVGTPIWSPIDVLQCVDIAQKGEILLALSPPDPGGWVLVATPRGSKGLVFKRYLRKLNKSRT